jgi:hypothetical protein
MRRNEGVTMADLLLIHGGLWEEGMDAAIDTEERAHLMRLVATPEVIEALLAGQTLRGLTDAELASLTLPVGVLRSAPANPFHQQHTADALLRLLPQAAELPGCPESPRSEFPPYLEPFLDAVAAFAATSQPGR